MSKETTWVFYSQEGFSSKKKAFAVRIGLKNPQRSKEAKQLMRMLDEDEIVSAGYCTIETWMNELFKDNNGIL